MSGTPNKVDQPEFEELIERYYENLYRFALSLAKNEAEACDLTQQTFFLWASKGHQLRDKSKVKSWLFTTLHREFLGSRRRRSRFPHHELTIVEHELPKVTPAQFRDVDSATVMETLWEIDEMFRTPLVLFYLQDHSYQEIAEILQVPTGTVMSRLSRAKEQLRARLAITKVTKQGASKVVPLSKTPKISPTGPVI